MHVYLPTHGHSPNGNQMEHSPQTTEPPPKILRRIGGAALHHNCSCPLSWRRVVIPLEDGRFAFTGRHHAELESKITEQMLELDPDGGGGVAPYENTLINHRRDVTQSLKLALWMSGIRELPDASIQDGLFAYPLEPIPARVPERF